MHTLYLRPLYNLSLSVDQERQIWRYFILVVILHLLSLTAPPAIVTSYAVDPDPCVGISFIQQDDPPIVLSVNVTADPCPTAVWTKDGGAVPASGVTVSLPGFSISHYLLPLYPSRK